MTNDASRFGAQVMSEASGVIWNDQMDDFSIPGRPNYFHIPPSPANYISPGKRPMSSTSPLVIFNPSSGEVMTMGAAGGSTIISGVSGTALRIIRLNEDVKQAVDRPRIHNQLKPNITNYEDKWPKVFHHTPRTFSHQMVEFICVPMNCFG